MEVRELVVVSHLRWTWLWQRPQHVVSRLAEGRRTWFVEEPRAAGVAEPRLHREEAGPVTRVWLELPAGDGRTGFDATAAEHAALLPELLGPPADRVVLLYAPTGLAVAETVRGDLLVYDVLEHRDGPEHHRALERADVVFTAGRAVHEAVHTVRPERTHLFGDGVEPEHFVLARQKRRPARRPVAGHVGVVDARLDLDLVAALADALPEWEVRLVGPVVALDPEELPTRTNLTYDDTSPTYEQLPSVLSSFDVAVMPFVTEGQTSTKTLEYLAAGLPVVSTPLPDVVEDFGKLVAVEPDAAGLAEACERVRVDDAARRERKARPVLHWHHWDTIVARMERQMTDVAAGRVVR